MASRRDPSRAPTETSANRQCLPRKETRSRSAKCVHHAASIRTYCRPDKREGLRKTRAATSPTFWAGGNRQSGAFEDPRVHCLSEPSLNSTFIPPNLVHAGTLAGLLRFRRRGFRAFRRFLSASCGFQCSFVFG